MRFRLRVGTEKCDKKTGFVGLNDLEWVNGIVLSLDAQWDTLPVRPTLPDSPGGLQICHSPGVAGETRSPHWARAVHQQHV